MAKKSSLQADHEVNFKDTVLPGSGKRVRVYAPAEHIINSVIPEQPRPRRPQISMATKVGEQLRAAKEGDPEYDEWLAEKEIWEEERNQLQADYRLVMCLRDEFPRDGDDNILDAELEFTAGTWELMEDGVIEKPSGKHAKYRLRAMWLRDWVVRGMGDEMEVQYTSHEIAGMDKEAVDWLRDSFRRDVIGEATKRMGTEAAEGTDAGEPEEVV